MHQSQLSCLLDSIFMFDRLLPLEFQHLLFSLLAYRLSEPRVIKQNSIERVVSSLPQSKFLVDF